MKVLNSAVGCFQPDRTDWKSILRNCEALLDHFDIRNKLFAVFHDLMVNLSLRTASTAQTRQRASLVFPNKASEIDVAGQFQPLLQFATLFDSVQNALVWVKDRNGRYCWVNRAFQISFAADRPRIGSGSEEVLGKTDYDLSSPYLADQYRIDDEQVLAGKRIVNRIELVGLPEGSTVWNVTNKIPLTGMDGEIIGSAGISRRLDTPGKEAVPGTHFDRVLAHLRDHYHEQITNRELAHLAHMSVRAFERKFHATFHLTPHNYLRRLRLGMASHALVYTRHSLSEVALQCGFVDQSHFSREFRRHFGRTPRDYRAQFSLESETAASGTNTAASRQSRAGRRDYNLQAVD
jgi:AraC-like DNA-binding protein/PAS domain-containing protein